MIAPQKEYQEGMQRQSPPGRRGAGSSSK